jgi:hypothetical protein
VGFFLIKYAGEVFLTKYLLYLLLRDGDEVIKKSPNMFVLKARATKHKAREQQQQRLNTESIKRLNFYIVKSKN